MKLEALSRLSSEKPESKTELTAAPYPRFLLEFDEEVKRNPSRVKSLAKMWLKNKMSTIDADIDRAFSGPSFAPYEDQIRDLKKRLVALTNV